MITKLNLAQAWYKNEIAANTHSNKFYVFIFLSDVCFRVRYDIQIPFLQLVVTKGIEAKNSPNIFNG